MDDFPWWIKGLEDSHKDELNKNDRPKSLARGNNESVSQ